MKDQLVEIIQLEGYDFVSACEIASKFMKEIKDSKRDTHIFGIGLTTIKIRNRKYSLIKNGHKIGVS